MWVIGTGPLGERLRADAPEAPEGDEFLGRVSDEKKFERLVRAHVLLMTSVQEDWVLLVTEAAQLGTPTIACDVPGFRDSVMAANGISTSPDPKHLSAALRRHLANWVAEELPLVTPGGVIP
jgi:glycosyltransferase involved in cell wall biosynthesis